MLNVRNRFGGIQFVVQQRVAIALFDPKREDDEHLSIHFPSLVQRCGARSATRSSVVTRHAHAVSHQHQGQRMVTNLSHR